MEGKEELKVSDNSKKEGGRERDERIRKLEELRAMGVNPYPYRFERTHTLAQAAENEEALSAGDASASFAGRILAVRGHGHTSFGNLKDGSGTLQFYIKDAEVDVDPYDFLPKWLISRRSVRGRAQLCRVLP